MKLTRRSALAGAALAPLARTARAAPVTLEFTTWHIEEPGFSTFWKEFTAAFQAANPNVAFSMTGGPLKDYIDQLTIRFASNRPPPVMELPSDNLGSFASQGWLAPLDARIKGTPIATDWSPL